MAEIFQRLNVPDRTNLSSRKTVREVHPVVVPIAFSVLPTYIDRMWVEMKSYSTHRFRQLDTEENKNIFKKISLILAEAKVCYAQRAHIEKPDEELLQRKQYTGDELNEINNSAITLPWFLALYIDSIGNTKEKRLTVTPILAELQGEEAHLSGAVTYAPRQLVPLLKLLRDGVPKNDRVHQIALSLDTLPGLKMEEYSSSSGDCVRLTDESSQFWLDGDDLAMRDEEFKIFRDMIKTQSLQKGFNVTTDLSHGKGTLAQIIQTPKWNIDQWIAFFSMSGVCDDDIKLGATFGFGHYKEFIVKPSRYSGSFKISFKRGEVIPYQVITSFFNILDHMRDQ